MIKDKLEKEVLKLKETTDEKMESISRKKNNLLLSFIEAVKEGAVDCELFKAHNMMGSNYKCFQFNEDSLFDSALEFEKVKDHHKDAKHIINEPYNIILYGQLENNNTQFRGIHCLFKDKVKITVKPCPFILMTVSHLRYFGVQRNGTSENLSRTSGFLKVTCPGKVTKQYFCTALLSPGPILN